MQRKFQLAFHVAGTLGADLAIIWTAPSPCTLVHVSAVATDANAAGLEVGTTTTAAAYLVKYDIGVSSVPVEKQARSDFVGSQFPRISDGDVLKLTLDYDYNGGGGSAASDNVTIVCTFVEG